MGREVAYLEYTELQLGCRVSEKRGQLKIGGNQLLPSPPYWKQCLLAMFDSYNTSCFLTILAAIVAVYHLIGIF